MLKEKLNKIAIINRRNGYQKSKLTANQKKTFIFELINKYCISKSPI